MRGHIHSPVYIESNKLSIGENSFINANCKIYNGMAEVVIGKNCSIAYNVSFVAVTHEKGDEHRRAKEAYGKAIVVEDGCWIGANTLVLPGVHIKRGCIIAAGSVVIRDCEENSLYAGVPAIKIRGLE